MTRRTLFASIAALFVGRKAQAVAPIYAPPKYVPAFYAPPICDALDLRAKQAFDAAYRDLWNLLSRPRNPQARIEAMYERCAVQSAPTDCQWVSVAPPQNKPS